MNIGIAGLGLIGGSFAKAFKKYTDNKISVYDINNDTVKKALEEQNADENLLSNISEIDLLILALYPDHSIQFINKFKDKISEKTVVIDCAGIKQKVCEKIGKIANEYGFVFVGGHPMAGIEKSGYDASLSGLFKGASMILTPDNSTDKKHIEFIKEALSPLGFSQFKISTPAEHDKIIAFTSQLAHVVSSAYILSPAAKKHHGFSAGSFKDMTRVARLNEYMWTELFLGNKDNLATEIGLLIDNLKEFKQVIENAEEKKLLSMLKRGRKDKENSLLTEKNQ